MVHVITSCLMTDGLLDLIKYGSRMLSGFRFVLELLVAPRASPGAPATPQSPKKEEHFPIITHRTQGEKISGMCVLSACMFKVRIDY